jgi:adenylate cyclase
MGEVVIADNTITGSGVVLAQRLEQKAPAGGICIQGSVYDTLPKRLPFSYTDLGEITLKGFEDAVRAYKVDENPNVEIPPPRLKQSVSPNLLPTGQKSLAIPHKPSIAVLPFENMSGDPEQEYFSDGISEDIITALSRFRSFQVTARSSAFSYKGLTVEAREVGKELGVRYIIQGSVRKSGNRVRISPHLIDAETGTQIWADRFDRELVDIFSLQDEITETIVGRIEQQLGSIERSRALRKRTDDLESWDLFQRGMFYVWQMTGSSLAEGAVMLLKSLKIDPSFAEAHAWISFTFLHQVYLNTVDNLGATIATAREHAQKAITYDENLDLGHEMIARIFIFERRYDEAVAAAERAVQLNPNSTSANFSLGVVLIFADRFDEALEPTQRAMRLSPKDHRRANHLNSLGIVLSEIGRLDEGIKALREAVSLQHEDYRSALWLARYASEKGQVEEAKRAAEIVMKLKPEFSLSRLPDTFGSTFTATYIERFMPYIQDLGFPE